MANDYWSNLNKQVKEQGMDPGSAQRAGLTKAYGLLDAGTNIPYPTDYSGSLKAPERVKYYDLTKYDPYERLDEGQYEKVRAGIQAPILSQSQANRAQIGDVMSGRGLYGSVGGTGSGLMSGALTQEQQATQEALGKTEADIANIRMEEAQNIFAAQKALADQMNQYQQGGMQWKLMQDELIRNFLNKQKQLAFENAANQAAWQAGQAQTKFDRALGLAGLGSSGAGVQAQMDAAKKAADAQQMGSLFEGLGTLGGMGLSAWLK